jgi:hypothetical protein
MFIVGSRGEIVISVLGSYALVNEYETMLSSLVVSNACPIPVGMTKDNPFTSERIMDFH